MVFGKHSRIVQRKISRPQDALKEFVNYGPDGTEIPLVCVPKWNYLFYFMMNVPSGVHVLQQKWSAHAGNRRPGLIMFWPAWNRISHIVTMTANIYNAPVKNCPTSDNVMVAVDVSVTFTITDPKLFVYNLGASRFDELMSAQTDEAIRGLVRGVRAMSVLDLREVFAAGMLTGLNAKLKAFGIIVNHVKITNVELPHTLAATLQNTTSFKAQIEQQEKAHQAKMRVLYDDAERTITAIRRANERRVQDLSAKIQRALIERDERMLQTRSHMEVGITNAKADFSVAKVQATSEKLNAEAEGKRLAVERVERMRADAEARKVAAEQKLVSSKLEAEALIAESKAEAEALTVMADVEERAATELLEERKYTVEMKRINAMVKMAANGKMVIGGTTGERLLQELSTPAAPRLTNGSA